MLIEVESSCVVVMGSSNGNGDPRYEFFHLYGHGGPIREALDEMYCQGINCAGGDQVRDMVFAMSRVAEKLGYELVIPGATQVRVEKEAKFDGAVF
jgi:hypothetical protein